MNKITTTRLNLTLYVNALKSVTVVKYLKHTKTCCDFTVKFALQLSQLS